MQLTLLVPELIWPEPDDQDAFANLSSPALSTLFCHSRLTRRPPQSFEAMLTDAFGQAEDAPYAAFRRLGETITPPDNPDGHWLCSDPVHLRYHEELLILADSGSFDITQEEAEALGAELNRHFADVGRFHVTSAERWYLQLADRSFLDTRGVPPLSSMAGRSLENERPETTAQKALHKLITEIQMLLHAHAINEKREAAGKMPINSLWLWGAGALPPRRECDFDGVWSNNALAHGLARAAGVPTHALPNDATTLFEHAAPDTHHCVVLEDLLAPVQYEKRDVYRSALTGLEKRWFEPLRAALRSGRIEGLRIEASTAYALLTWDSTRRNQWAFWKRPQSLHKIAQELAQHSV